MLEAVLFQMSLLMSKGFEVGEIDLGDPVVLFAVVEVSSRLSSMDDNFCNATCMSFCEVIKTLSSSRAGSI